MILRRFTEHVKAQNWLAVGLDFFIVVVGVFIGLQVSNWNAALGDRDRETQILNEPAAFGDVDEDARLKLVSANPQLSAVLQTQLGWAKGHFIVLISANSQAITLLKQIEEELTPPSPSQNR